MNSKRLYRLILMSWLIFGQNISYAVENTGQIGQAMEILRDIIATGIIPTKVLQNAPAIIIIPDMEKVSIGIGGTLGKGVLVARLKQQWSSPVFVSLAAVNWDFPQGVKTIDVLIIFKNGKGAGNFNMNSGKTNIDAGLATVYAYSDNTVTEISVNTPAELEVERTLFTNFYGEEVNVADVLAGKIASDVSDVVQLKAMLATLTKK